MAGLGNNPVQVLSTLPDEMQPRLPKQQHTSIQQAEEEEDQPNFCSGQPPGNTEQLFAAK
jgi:hypothetical protein